MFSDHPVFGINHHGTAASRRVAGRVAPMDVSCSPRVSRHVVFTDLDGEIVMLDAKEGRYYELDPVASRIWLLLHDGTSVSRLCDVLTAEYEVDGQTCRDDVSEFIARLGELGMVDSGMDR